MEDTFDIYLIDIICNETIDVTQYIINKYSLEDDKEKKEILLNTMKIYINGDIDEEHQIKFLVELDSILKNKKNKEFKLKIYAFFEDMQKILTDNFAFNLLNKLLGYSKKSYELTKFIWSLKIFRNQIKNFKTYANSQDFLDNSIFKNMFISVAGFINPNTEKTVKCYKKLCEDEEIQEDLINYVNKIVNLNSAYCSVNMDVNIRLKKCSRIDFNYFLFKFLKQMYNNYKTKNNVIISRDISHQVKEFCIKDLNLGEKIYITLLQCFRNIAEFAGKKIYTINNIKLSNFLKQILCNDEIQDIFIDYENNYNNIKLEEILETCVNYYDYVIAYNTKLNLNITLKREFYDFISNILGGLNGNIKNSHIRIALFTIIQLSYNKTGFNIYNNFFDNLFKYINEVDYAKFGMSYMKDKISHHFFLTEILLQMTDLCKNIDDKSKYIFAETIYRLISTSYEYFDMFNEKLSEELKDATDQELLYYSMCYNITLELTLYTILIYNNLYDRKIIETVYPELEEKIIYFVGRIFGNIKNKKNYIFDFSLYKHKTEILIKYCFEFIDKRLESNTDTVFEIKENLFNALKIYDCAKSELIKNKLETYKEIENFPDDFTDPLTCKIIKNPVMIPNSTEIFERTSIISQIYGQGINPYTREKLTIEILEEYNNKLEIKNKIKDFESKFKLWRENK